MKDCSKLIPFQKFEACEPMPNLHDRIIMQMLKDADYKRDKQIEERLNQLGYAFGNDLARHDFYREHLTRLTYPDKPQWVELYLDYGTLEQIAIASYWDTVEITPGFDGINASHSLTITVGNPPKL